MEFTNITNTTRLHCGHQTNEPSKRTNKMNNNTGNIIGI